ERKAIIGEESEGEITISNIDGKVEVGDPILFKGASIEKDDIFPKAFTPEELPPGTPLLSVPFFPMMVRALDYNISIYDFARGIVRDAVSVVAKAELEENGSNLAVVLKNIMSKSDGKRKLLNLVDYALPFVDDLVIERFADKFLLFKLKEKYSDQYLPGFLLSDGTINTIALVVALYFEKQPLAIFEEPEYGIHPYLISEVIDMMRDASENKQIIAATHSPEMVRHANKEDILLISRDEEGFSTICRPSKKEDVNRFLENGMRMEELYVNDLLEL
ncbi:AAA family ATPase, partial [Candidatus Poribacteria bacterium]